MIRRWHLEHGCQPTVRMDLGRGRPHQVTVPPGFYRALGLVPVQGEAEALLLRDIQHQAHVLAICRHVEPGQGCGGMQRQTVFPHLFCTAKPGSYPPTALWSFLQTT